MSLSGIVQIHQHPGSAGADKSLLLNADNDLSSKLTLGQIIKCKVTRHYEGNRYGILISGQERVVDSTFPLLNGQLFYARVIGLDEKVHLQRVVDPAGKEQLHDNSAAEDHFFKGLLANHDSIAQLFADCAAILTPDQHALVGKLQSKLGGSRLVVLGALILNKLDIKLNAALIQSVYRALNRAGLDLTGIVPKQGLAKLEHAQSDKIFRKNINELAQALEQLCGHAFGTPLEDHGMHPADSSGSRAVFSDTIFSENDFGHSGNRDQQEWLLGQWMLNVQTQGSVAHRYLQVPLWFGDRLVEVSLALFAQTQSSHDEHFEGADETLRYKKAVFSLNTEYLGHLEIHAKVVRKHLHIEVIAQSLDIADFLGEHFSTLAASLKHYGWMVDEISYHVRKENAGVAEIITEHYITQGSLNQVM